MYTHTHIYKASTSHTTSDSYLASGSVSCIPGSAGDRVILIAQRPSQMSGGACWGLELGYVRFCRSLSVFFLFLPFNGCSRPRLFPTRGSCVGFAVLDIQVAFSSQVLYLRLVLCRTHPQTPRPSLFSVLFCSVHALLSCVLNWSKAASAAHNIVPLKWETRNAGGKSP